ncbi:MAG: class I SAM-dependent methyltransferase [Reyranellaceae bacterium]
MTDRIIDIDVRAGYAAWAEGYDAQDNPMIAAVERHLDAEPVPFAGARVLDIGCGTGRLLGRALAGGAAAVTGIDGSPEMLALARQRLARDGTDGRATLVESDLLAPWPLPPAAFDLALISLVLEHVAEIAPILATAAHHLARGGLLVIAELHPDMLRSSLGGHFDHGGRRYALPSHRHDRDEFVAALGAAGFAPPVVTELRADAATIAAIPKFAKHAGHGVLLALRARRSGAHAA